MTDFSVLFVDDEPITRRISSRLLGRHFEVIEAIDGREALDILSQDSGRVGVIITDMKMANMDGATLIDLVSKNYPEIPIIASTGDLSNYDFATLIGQGKVFSAIEKPWDLKQALGIIEAAFRTRQTARD